MDRDEGEDGGGTLKVVVLAGGSLVDVWADSGKDIIWVRCTTDDIVLGVAAFDVWGSVTEGVTVTVAGANVVLF